MKMKIFAVILFALSVAISEWIFADEIPFDQDQAAEVQLDAQYEEGQTAQLQNDKDFMVQDNIKSQKELSSEKSRVSRLKSKNEKLTSDIKKHSSMARERRALVAHETHQADRLEKQVAAKEAQLEKIKIANVELRKSLDELRVRIAQANAKAHKLEAQKQRALAARKALQEKRKQIKLSKSGRVRTASL